MQALDGFAKATQGRQVSRERSQLIVQIRSARPSRSASSRLAAGSTSGIHSKKVIHRPSWRCGPGAIDGLEATAKLEGARGPGPAQRDRDCRSHG
jgi:hypothetical protein